MVRFLVRSRLWVSLAVGGLTAFFALLVGASQLRCAALAFTCTLLIYSVDAAVDQRHSPAIMQRFVAAAALAALTMVGAMMLLPALTRVVVGCGMLLAGLYFLPQSSQLGALSGGVKRVVHLKAPFIGVAVSLATMAVPFTSVPSSGLPWGPLGLLAPSVVCFMSANSLLCDIADEHADRIAEVPTVPVLRGRRAALCLAQRLIGLGLGFSLLVPAIASISAGAAMAILGICMVAAARWIERAPQRDRVCLVLDGLLLVPWVVQTGMRMMAK